jgi:hypothetical protein
MTEIADFLTARLAEDEAAARTVPPGPWWVDDDLEDANDVRLAGAEPSVGRAPTIFFSPGAKVYGDEELAPFRFAARFDPAWVLADIAAKRALIDYAFGNASNIDSEWGDGCSPEQIRAGECRDTGGRAAMIPLRLLAAPHSEHPDFKPEWRING